MAVYKIFPTQDATMYSMFPQMNTGIDEIIESSTTTFGPFVPNPQVSRFLIQFDSNEINSIINIKQTNLLIFYYNISIIKNI